MTQAARICQKIEITGRVQGVGYRYWMQQMADKFGITGWVRNTFQGKVEAVVCGDRENIALILAACEKGPGFANVSAVTVLAETDDHFDNFETRRTV